MVILHRSSATDDPRKPDLRMRRRVAAVAKFVGVVIVFPILMGLIVAAFLINSSRGRDYVIHLVQDQAKSLGVSVHLQNFNLHLATLSVDLYGLTIDGAAPHPNPPLLQVQHAQAGVRIVSIFGAKWYFDSIRVDNPVAHIYVDKNGNSNIPTIKSSNSNSNTSVFDLGIRRAVLTNGAVFYNDQPKAIAVDLSDVQLNSTFDAALKKYSGSLAYSDGQINYGGSQAPPHKLSIQFDATPTTFHLSPAKIDCGNSHVLLTATVNNYNAPSVQAQYNATVDGQQFAGLLHSSSIPAGLVSVSGTAQYQSDPNRPLLQTLVVNGDVNSRQLVEKTPSIQATVSNIAGHYSLANGDATMHDFRASLLGGEVTLQGTMENIGTDKARSNASATLRGISLADELVLPHDLIRGKVVRQQFLA